MNIMWRPSLIGKNNFMSKKFKIMIGILLIPIAFFAYATFFPGGGKDAGNLAETAQTAPTTAAKTESSTEGREILNVLNSLKAVKMDIEFFNDKIFKSLVDFSVELAPQPAGRLNPFAPI